MGVLDRLRAWWRRFRAGDAGAPAGYECVVCGTEVDDADGSCPLCRSTDVVRAGVSADADSADETAAKGGPARRVAASDDASVGRLRELREDGELLERYADRWQSVDGGFRVETSGGTRVVDSREEVVALLRAEAG